MQKWFEVIRKEGGEEEKTGSKMTKLYKYFEKGRTSKQLNKQFEQMLV